MPLCTKCASWGCVLGLDHPQCEIHSWCDKWQISTHAFEHCFWMRNKEILLGQDNQNVSSMKVHNNWDNERIMSNKSPTVIPTTRLTRAMELKLSTIYQLNLIYMDGNQSLLLDYSIYEYQYCLITLLLSLQEVPSWEGSNGIEGLFK